MLALDTDVFVAWAMSGAPHHVDVRVLVEGELAARRGRVVLTPRCVEEFLHVTTDPKRFERPLTMKAALTFVNATLSKRDVVCIAPQAAVLSRTIELMNLHGLGRKRILDTALAAHLELAGITQLATFNGKDFSAFEFITAIDPRRRRH